MNYHIFLCSNILNKCKNKFKIKKSNNSTFLLLVFGILKFQNIGRFTLGCFKRLTTTRTWGLTFGMTKCRTADISDFQNFEYEKNESRFIRFFYL